MLDLSVSYKVSYKEDLAETVLYKSAVAKYVANVENFTNETVVYMHWST